jgi:hypothetical protein
MLHTILIYAHNSLKRLFLLPLLIKILLKINAFKSKLYTTLALYIAKSVINLAFLSVKYDILLLIELRLKNTREGPYY